jgi:hypothetical protein
MRQLIGIVLIMCISLFGNGLAFAQATHAKSAAKDAAKKEAKVQPVSPQELSIAERVHVGQLPCELGATVRLTADANAPGYFNLQGKGYKYRMRPVATSTGAIRLEDEKAGAVWLQLANKSMLMDQKKGRRLADECAHPEQVAIAKDMKVNPPPALIDVNTTSVPR